MPTFPVLSTGARSQYPYSETDFFYVVQNYLDCGAVVTHCLNPGNKQVRFTVTCDSITAAERATLESFFAAVAGRLGTFSFIDDDGTTWSKCRFDQEKIDWKYIQAGQYSTTFKILAIAP